MPSNFDILAANDFARNPFLEDVVRRIHGDRTNVETVSAVVEIDNQTAGANTSDGGLNQRPDKHQSELAGRLEVAIDQETFHDDAWEVGGDLWKSVGSEVGKDAGSKTIVVRRIQRHRGRQANTNTQA